MEHLLRDYHDAQEELRTLKYSILKERLVSADSSRQAMLQWLSEFMVFVGSNHATLVQNPDLVFQYAINQVRHTLDRALARRVRSFLSRPRFAVTPSCSLTRQRPPKLPRSSWSWSWRICGRTWRLRVGARRR